MPHIPAELIAVVVTLLVLATLLLIALNGQIIIPRAQPVTDQQAAWEAYRAGERLVLPNGYGVGEASWQSYRAGELGIVVPNGYGVGEASWQSYRAGEHDVMGPTIYGVDQVAWNAYRTGERLGPSR